MSVSDDGNTLYVVDSVNDNPTTIDVSEVQARKANPVVREISRLTWNTVTIPQNAYPMQIHGKPYLLEFDEYAFRFSTPPPPDTVGAARIIDISDPAHPRVVSNIRLEVNQPAQHHAADGDPGTLKPVQGIRRPLLLDPARGGPGDRRLLVHQLGRAHLQHPGSSSPA